MDAGGTTADAQDGRDADAMDGTVATRVLNGRARTVVDGISTGQPRSGRRGAERLLTG